MTTTAIRSFSIRFALFSLFLLPLVPAKAALVPRANAQETPLVYRLSIPTPSSQRIHIRIREEHPTDKKIEFAIPAWTPGYYQILQFQNDIENVRVTDENGHSVPFTHPSSRVWTVDTEGIASPPTQLILDYDVYAHDLGLGFFGSALDAEHERGYVNGASTFMYETGKTARPVRLEAALPTGWNIATPLDPRGEAVPTAQASVGAAPLHTYEAESYDTFIDCPIQLGKFSSTEFTSDNATFQCVCIGGQDWDKAKVGAVLKKIVHTGIGVFGKAPFKRYVFFYHVGGGGFEGGLEHHNSTVIHIGDNLQSGKAEEFQSVTAHEFFHAWNVKRLRPAGLGPFDYTQQVRSPSLWWAEGVTDYYADLILYRSGLRDRTWLLADLANRMNELDNNPARLAVSLEDAGRKAWEGESEGFGGLSYYLKGSLIGLYFDLRLRALTGGQRSLDDVMRLLDAEYGSKNKAYPEEALLAALESVAQTDLHAEYAQLLRAPGEVSWEGVLTTAGLALQRDASSYLGVQLGGGKNGKSQVLRINSVEIGSAALRCGLQPGDTLEALNGDPVTLDSFRERLGRLAPRFPITLKVLRDGETLMLTGDSGVRYSRYRLSIGPQKAGAPPVSTLFLPVAQPGTVPVAP